MEEGGALYDWGVYLVAGVVSIVVIASALPASWPVWARQIATFGAVMRVVGAEVRYEIIVEYYGGFGDAMRYYRHGLEVREQVFAGHGNDVIRDWFANDVIWGTAFLDFSAGGVITVLGPSLRGAFVVYATIGYAGLLLILHAIARTVAPSRAIVTLFAFMPSLWFWPSSIGKEAIMMLAFGLVTNGLLGPQGKVLFRPLFAGLGLAFMVRPHIAALIGAGIVLADLVDAARDMNASRVGRAIAIGVVASFVVVSALDSVAGTRDSAGVQEFMTNRAGKTEQGGSKISRPTGPLAIPMAYVNIFMRPFPWDVKNAPMAVSALELMFLWGIVVRRPTGMWESLRRWRQEKTLRFAMLLVLIIALFYGLSYGNLGIISRQRVVLLPYFILLVELPPMLLRRAQQGRRARPARPASVVAPPPSRPPPPRRRGPLAVPARISSSTS